MTMSMGPMNVTITSETTPKACTWKAPCGVLTYSNRDLMKSGSMPMGSAKACTTLIRATERNGIRAKGIGGETSMKMHSMKAWHSCVALKAGSESVENFLGKRFHRLVTKRRRML